MRLLTLASLALALLTAPATARPHPQTEPLTDVAARPSYPVEVAVRRIRRFAAHHVRHGRHEARLTVHRHRAVPPHKSLPVSDPAPPIRVVKSVITASAMALGAILGIPEGWADGLSEPMPVIVRRRPYRLEGTLTIAGRQFRYVSGGAGRGSIPYGDHPIDDSEGGWGTRHGALGLAGGTIYDPQVGGDREGIELHAGHGRTLGCVAFENWRELKKMILAMQSKFGRAVLHVWPGAVSITPSARTDVAVVYLPERETPRHSGRHRRERYAAR